MASFVICSVDCSNLPGIAQHPPESLRNEEVLPLPDPDPGPFRTAELRQTDPSRLRVNICGISDIRIRRDRAVRRGSHIGSPEQDFGIIEPLDDLLRIADACIDRARRVFGLSPRPDCMVGISAGSVFDRRDVLFANAQFLAWIDYRNHSRFSITASAGNPPDGNPAGRSLFCIAGKHAGATPIQLGPE